MVKQVFLAALVALSLVACGTIRVEGEESGVLVLSFEMSAYEHMREVERKMIQRAWEECPKGWEQVIDPERDYAGGYGENLRLYRAEGGTFGLYQAKIRCKEPPVR